MEVSLMGDLIFFSQVSVKVMTLEDAIKHFGDDETEISYLKVDVEGSEIEAIPGKGHIYYPSFPRKDVPNIHLISARRVNSKNIAKTTTTNA